MWSGTPDLVKEFHVSGSTLSKEHPRVAFKEHLKQWLTWFCSLKSLVKQGFYIDVEQDVGHKPLA